jgi:hypothetical protein
VTALQPQADAAKRLANAFAVVPRPARAPCPIRCRRFDRSPADVAEIVLDGHSRRRSNPGSADWLVETSPWS